MKAGRAPLARSADTWGYGPGREQRSCRRLRASFYPGGDPGYGKVRRTVPGQLPARARPDILDDAGIEGHKAAPARPAYGRCCSLVPGPGIVRPASTYPLFPHAAPACPGPPGTSRYSMRQSGRRRYCARTGQRSAGKPAGASGKAEGKAMSMSAPGRSPARPAPRPSEG